MSGFGDAYLKAMWGKLKFNIALFSMTPEERMREFGEDEVEKLRAMPVEVRMAKYGRDYSEFLNKN